MSCSSWLRGPRSGFGSISPHGLESQKPRTSRIAHGLDGVKPSGAQTAFMLYSESRFWGRLTSHSSSRGRHKEGRKDVPRVPHQPVLDCRLRPHDEVGWVKHDGSGKPCYEQRVPCSRTAIRPPTASPPAAAS